MECPWGTLLVVVSWDKEWVVECPWGTLLVVVSWDKELAATSADLLDDIMAALSVEMSALLSAEPLDETSVGRLVLLD